MSALYPILSLLGYAFAVQLLSRSEIRTSLLLAICCLINLMYLFGLAHQLELGATITFWLGIALLIVISILKMRVVIGQIKPNLLYFLPFIFFYRAIPADFFFTGWDEFSHWAISIKFLFLNNQIYQAKDALPIGHYPPGQQIFQYWFLISAQSGWSEKLILYSQTFFSLAGLLFISNSSLLNQRYAFAYFVASILIVHWLSNLGSTFFHIYPDALFGILFASALIMVAEPKKSTMHYLSLATILSTLVLEKQIGLVLAGMIIVWMLLEGLLPSLGQQAYSHSKSRFLGVLLCTSTIAFSAISWGIYSSPSPTPSTARSPATTLQSSSSIPEYTSIKNSDHWELHTYLKNLKTKIPLISTVENSYDQLLKIGLPLRIVNILDALWHKARDPLYRADSLNLSIPIYSFLLACLSLIIFFYLKSYSTADRRAALLTLFTYLNLFVYITFLLFAYLFFFSEYEANKLASFERYIGTYAIALCLSIAICFFNYISALQKIFCYLFLIIFFAVCIILMPSRLVSQWTNGFDYRYDSWLTESAATNVEKVHYELINLLKLIPRVDNKPYKIYFVHQNTKGYTKWAFGYLSFPHKTQLSCWSLGKAYYTGDIWTCNQSLEEASKDYDYLVLYGVDDRFWNEHGNKFEPSESALSPGVYKIQKSDQGVNYHRLRN